MYPTVCIGAQPCGLPAPRGSSITSDWSAAAGRGAAILAIRPSAEAGDRRVASGGDLHRIGDRVEVGRERHLVVHGPDMCVDLM